MAVAGTDRAPPSAMGSRGEDGFSSCPLAAGFFAAIETAPTEVCLGGGVGRAALLAATQIQGGELHLGQRVREPLHALHMHMICNGATRGASGGRGPP
jgi:hypothetical protein